MAETVSLLLPFPAAGDTDSQSPPLTVVDLAVQPTAGCTVDVIKTVCGSGGAPPVIASMFTNVTEGMNAGDGTVDPVATGGGGACGTGGGGVGVAGAGGLGP